LNYYCDICISQLKQSIIEKTIWLVFENGAGIMHKAFEHRVDALALIEVLKVETGFVDAFDIVPITYQY
jgi:hypothetical protein